MSSTRVGPRIPTICHCSPVQQTLDYRAFYRECVPLAAEGFHMQLAAAHGKTGREQGVELVPLPKRTHRALRMLTASALLPGLLSRHAELYHFHDPELLPVALVLKLLFRKSVVYDTREDFPSMMANKQYLPRAVRPLIGKIVSALEYVAARTLDGLIAADTATMRRFAQVRNSKKLVFFDFPNLDLFPEPQEGARLFDVVYRGGLSDRAGAFVLLEALRILANNGKQIRTLLIGYFDDQQARDVFLDQVRSSGLASWIEVRDRIEHREMAAAISQARIGICPLKPIPKFLRNMPIKVFEYWACGLPVVASDLPPIRPFFCNGKYGLLVKPGDARELAAAIAWLLDHPQEAVQMGKQGRRAVVQRYNNPNEVRKLIAFYRRILAPSNG